MSTPTWILEIFSVIMILVAEVSAAQLVMARAWTRRGLPGADIVVSQLLIAIALAGVLVPGLSALPSTAWEIVFAFMTAWFAWSWWQETRARSTAPTPRTHPAPTGQARAPQGRTHPAPTGQARTPHAPHLVHSAAMLYLFAALAAPSAGSGTSMSGDDMSGMTDESSRTLPTLHAPTLALILVLLLIAYTVHDLDHPAAVNGYFQVAGRGPVPAGPAPAATTAERLLLSPAVLKGCQVTIGVTTAFLLIIMI